MRTLAGKVALITGGGTGVGRATARLLADHGVKVAVNYRASGEEAQQTVAEIEESGGRGLVVQGDVADADAAQRIVSATVEAFGRLDFLVNNAGYTERIPLAQLESVTDEVWDRIMAVNVKGAFYCARAAHKAMAQENGQIVNIASNSGLTGDGSSLPYVVSKGALMTLTKALARALAPRVRVNAVAPGFIETRWIEAMEEIAEADRQLTPLGRLAQPEDVALAVYGLLINPQITGQTVVVDGGLVMQ